MSVQALCPDLTQLLERLTEACVPIPSPTPAEAPFQGGGQRCSPEGHRPPPPPFSVPSPAPCLLHPSCGLTFLSLRPLSSPPVLETILDSGQMPQTTRRQDRVTGAVGRCREPAWDPRKRSVEVTFHRERSREESRVQCLLEAGRPQAGSPGVGTLRHRPPGTGAGGALRWGPPGSGKTTH